MSKYIASYTETNSSNTIQLILDATDDAQAIKELRSIVKQGFRNETFAGVELSDGRIYQASNQHGVAQGRYLLPLF